MGINKWIDLPAWPPAATPTHWYLQSDRRLSSETPPASSQPSCYRYNPADPTPSMGGAVLNGGAKDNRQLEARPDVLSFTSEPVSRETAIMGPVSAVLYIRSSVEHTDFFVRLCDVSPHNGKSINICDGITHLTPGDSPSDPDGIRRVTITLSHTAHCFKKGHSIRLQVSSGAHPMYIRNLGTGEPIATGKAMRVADQEIFHDDSHPSAVILPMVSLPDLRI